MGMHAGTRVILTVGSSLGGMLTAVVAEWGVGGLLEQAASDPNGQVEGTGLMIVFAAPVAGTAGLLTGGLSACLLADSACAVQIPGR